VIRVLAAVFLVSVPQGAFAYPEMVRHGYMNCTSCHISPSGGGLLNLYGRVQAEEVLSTWFREGESAPFHGLLPEPEPLSFGGQFRALQVRSEDSTQVAGKTVLMQADLEAGVKWRNFQLVATAGVQDSAGWVGFLSRRHYLIFRPSEQSQWSFRVGRFQPNIGINMADHAIATKAGLGVGRPAAEPYNVEAAWLGEKFDVFVTAILGRPTEDRERGAALRASMNVGDTSKVGISYAWTTKTGLIRHLVGPYAIIGFSDRFFLLTELYLQSLATSSTTFGPAAYARLNYEFYRGVHGYLTGDVGQTNATKPATGGAGFGAQFFPRPHFEVRAEYNRRQDPYTGGLPADYAWAMFHYYL
jgi:hypothetical protein